jgi:protein-tyrosine phosphatase
MHFIDIHCHILPGLDDGAKDWDESLAMAQLALGDGFRTIVATPHQLGSYEGNDGETIRVRTQLLQERLDARGIPLTVLPGADVRVEPDLIEKIRSGRVVTLADRGRYVLLELPHELYVPLDRLLSELKAAGMTGILSHPERNQGILRQPQVLEPLLSAGCLMQVTAGSVVGTFGPEIQEFSEWMISEGMVHFLATDAHGPKSRRPLLGRAFDWAEDLVGYDAAYRMCCENPSRVIGSLDVERGLQRPRPSGLGAWLPWRRAG